MNIEMAYDKLYRYVFFRINDRETAEDITQETFFRYIRRYGQNGACNMRLMYTIARNLCVDEYRRQAPLPLPDEHELLPDQHVEKPHEKMIEKIMVDEALARLTGEEQELLLLRYVNEESVMTISKLHNCSRFSTYRKLKSALEKFSSYLEDKE